MSAMSDSGGGQYPVFDNEPLYLRLTLVFPYTKGMLFQNAVFQRDGQDGFAEVFRQRAGFHRSRSCIPENTSPASSPPSRQLPEPHLPRGYKALVGGTMGELDHAVLLEQYPGKRRAAELAPHWRGSAFELRENKKAGRVVLLYAAEWDSEESARPVLRWLPRGAGKEVEADDGGGRNRRPVTGTGDDGRFELRRNGAIVTSVEGLPPEIN